MTAADQDPQATIGHNRPPDELDALMDERFQPIIDRANELLALARKVPPEITNQEEADELTESGLWPGDIATSLKKIEGEVGRAHSDIKAPYLAAGRKVDARKNTILEPIARARGLLANIAGDFLERKRAAEEKARREAAEKARREAEERMREAEEREAAGKIVESDQAFQEAQQADRQAQRAERATKGKAADFSRTRGKQSVSTLAEVWDFEIHDFDAIDLNMLRTHLGREAVERALRSFVKANHNAFQIPGVRIFKRHQARFR